MAGMGGNYYAALGMEVARNDGSDYSKAASSSLNNASNSLHNIFDDTNKAFETGRKSVNDLFGILGTQATKDSPATGWLGLSEQLANEEKNTNRQIAENNAKDAFDLYLNKQREDLHTLLGKTNQKITDDESLKTTGLTTDALTNIIDTNIEKVYRSQIKGDISDATSQVPFTSDYVKRLILEPASYQLVKSSLTEAQRQTVEKLMADTNFVNAVKQEKNIKQSESDRANGIWTDEQLVDLAKELKANNHTVNNDMTTQDIYDMLVLERNAKLGRKANETMEEFNLRKAEAQNKLNNYLFGFSKDANNNPNNANNSNSNTASSNSKSSKQVSNKTQKRQLVDTKDNPINEEDIGNGLQLDIEDDISPTTLMQKMGDDKAKGEIVINEETGLPKGIQDETPKYFKAELDTDSETYSTDTTLLPTIDVDNATKYNEILHKNLDKLTPDGQAIYRDMIGIENKLSKAKVSAEFNNGIDGFSESNELKNILNRVQNNLLTYDDIEFIKDIDINKFKNKDNKDTISYLKKYIDYQEKLNSKLSNNKDSKFQVSDQSLNAIHNTILNTEQQIKVLQDRLKNINDEKDFEKTRNIIEDLQIKLKKLKEDKQTELKRRDMAIVSNTPYEQIIDASDETYQKSNSAAVVGVILDQDNIKVGNKTYDVSQAKKELFGDGIIDPQLGLLYHAFSESLDMDKTSSGKFLKEVLAHKDIKEYFNKYYVYANKLKANNKGKFLTEEELKSNALFETTLADVKKKANKAINEILSKDEYAHLKPRYGEKHKTTNKNPTSAIRYAGRLLINYHLMEPKNAEDVEKLFRMTK